MKKSKKLLTWAVGDFGVIIKAGFPTSTAAWEWAQDSWALRCPDFSDVDLIHV